MKVFTSIFTIFLAFGLFAQPGGGPKENKQDRKERIKAHKIAFISTELNLSSDEAEKFWPVYNEMEGEMEKIQKEKRSNLKKMREFDELSDEDAYNITEQVFELEAEETAIRKKYLGKFAGVVGKKKAAKVFLAEEKFKRELLKKIKKGNQNGGPRQGGPGGPGGPFSE
jgi:hypothetical protein